MPHFPQLMFKLDPQNPQWSQQFVDPYFSRAPSLDQRDLLFICEKIVLEKSESPLILLYFKRENKTRKKTLKK